MMNENTKRILDKIVEDATSIIASENDAEVPSLPLSASNLAYRTLELARQLGHPLDTFWSDELDVWLQTRR